MISNHSSWLWSYMPQKVQVFSKVVKIQNFLLILTPFIEVIMNMRTQEDRQFLKIETHYEGVFK